MTEKGPYRTGGDPSASAGEIVTAHDLEQARRAKNALLALRSLAVNGVGLTKHGSKYAVVLNTSEPFDQEELPASVNDVVILYQHIGEVRPQ